jgi:hypothetical protein
VATDRRFFLVERYLPAVSASAVGSAVDRLPRSGDGARHLCTFLVPDEETCLSLFEAANSITSALANEFAEAAITLRTKRLHALLDSVIPPLRRQLDALGPAQTAGADALSTKLQNLEALRLLPDPTLHLEAPATPAGSPVSPRPVLTVAAAILGALVLGIGAVLGAHLLDRRIEGEDDLRRYRIPILGEDLADKLGRAFEHEERINARERIADLSLEAIAEKISEIYSLVARAPCAVAGTHV